MKNRVVVVGAGGHARVILDILSDAADLDIAGFTSLDGRPETLWGYPYLGSDEALDGLLTSGIRHGFVAVGSNQRRSDCLRLLREKGFCLVNAISRAAFVSARARIGLSIALMPGAVVNAGAQLGDGVIVNTNASVDHDCVVGPCAHIGPGVSLAGGVHVGEGAFVGAGSTVVPNIEIGAWTTIGAGSLVIRNIADHAMAMGVPAELRRT